MPEPVRETTISEVDHKAVRLRRYIDLAIEDKPSFTLVRGIAADISSTGMRVVCDQYLHPKSRYIFTMKQNPNLVCKGEVRWVRPAAPNMHQCGVLFVDLPQGDRERLERFLVMERERAIIAASPAAATAAAATPAASATPAAAAAPAATAPTRAAAR